MDAGQLRRRKWELGLTNTELAARAGVSASTVAKLMEGKTMRPKKATMERVERALGFSAGAAEEFAALTDEERALLAAWRAMSPAQRGRLARLMEIVKGSGS